MGIREIVEARVRYGYRKIQVLLNREGWGGLYWVLSDFARCSPFPLHQLVLGQSSKPRNHFRIEKSQILADTAARQWGCGPTANTSLLVDGRHGYLEQFSDLLDGQDFRRLSREWV
jgi:hypothetical protein